MSAAALLLVEDNEDDVFFMQRALKQAAILNPLQVVQDGQEAMDYLAAAGKFGDRRTYPLPAALFLDLKLPYKSGHEVLAWIRQQKDLDSIPVVVLTSSNEPADLNKSFALGAHSYLVKPPKVQQLLDLSRRAGWTWLVRDA